MPSKPHVLSAIAALIAAASIHPAAAAPAAVPTNLSLSCREQPSLRVVVDDAGTLASEQEAAELTDAVTLRIVNIDRRANGPHIPARIDSDEPSLQVGEARWEPGTAVVDPGGRLRLDLTSDTLFIATPQLGNEALFRRFDCTRGQGATRYRCGSEDGLWVSAGADAATLRYGDGAKLRLPRIRSSAGDRFAAADGTTLEIKDDQAIYTSPGEDEQRCQIDD